MKELLGTMTKKLLKFLEDKNPRPQYMNHTLIIGLGNPGKNYEWTRHNLGWLVLDALKDSVDPGAQWEKHKKSNAQISKLTTNDQQIVLMKPQTFMNDSGDAVREYLAYNNGAPDQIIVIHDDVDLDLGRLKIVEQGSAAGHKGLSSIINQLKTDRFVRVRLGVRNNKFEKVPTEKFVLQHFGLFEKPKVKKWLPTIVEALECLINNEVSECKNKFH